MQHQALISSIQLCLNVVDRLKDDFTANPGLFAWASSDLDEYEKLLHEYHDFLQNNDLKAFTQDYRAAAISSNTLKTFKKQWEPSMLPKLQTFVDTLLDGWSM